MACSLLGTHSSTAQDWPAWRGPSGNGISLPADIPLTFSPTNKVIWSIDLPGRGSSCPSIKDHRIYLTSPVQGEDALIAYDLNGKELWTKTFGKERAGKHKNGSGSNPTPAVSDTHIYAYYKSGTLAAVKHDGTLAWKTNLQERFGEDTLWWDLGTSPVLAAGHVIIAVMQDNDSYLVAFDEDGGELAWKTDRNYDVQVETGQSYCTPQVFRQGGKPILVTFGADRLTGHHAGSGELVWECGGFNPENKSKWRTIASPAISDGIAFVTYGRAGHIAAVKLGGKGDITKNRLWEKAGIGADVPTPLAFNGHALLLTDKGLLSFMDIKTGEEKWRSQLPSNKGRIKYYASPAMAGDKLLMVREDGLIVTGTADETGFSKVSEIDMGQRIVATPVIVRNRIYLRGIEQLFCIGN